MCGLWGFQALAGPPNLDLLAHLAALAGTRGPHAHGSYSPERGREVAVGGRDARRFPYFAGSVIGHARLATSGAHDDLDCAQPLLVRDFAIAHNGTVPDANALAAREHLAVRTASDSEVLGRLIARDRLTPAHLAAALELATPGVPLALLLLRDTGTLLAARRGHPLHVLTRREGVYLCSLPFPGATPLDDNAVHNLRAGSEAPLTTRADLRQHDRSPQWTP